MNRDGVECNRDGDETRPREEDHKQRIGDGEQLSTPFTSKNVSDPVHRVNLGMVSLECTDNVTRPSSEKTNDQDD